MKTNEIRKGHNILLECGLFGIMKDNMRGNTRMVETHQPYTEIGSVYSHDIVRADIGDGWKTVEHTPAQVSLRKQVDAIFG